MARDQTAPLRRGWTTGACAAAAARAAFAALLTGSFPDPVTIRLPGGQTPSFALALAELANGAARAGIVKDAGDDPDVTHGALIVAELEWAAPGSGIRFRAGEGVGTVTRPGLPLAPGEPAINPAPRAMIRDQLNDVAEANGAPPPDITVTIAIPGGERLAEKTMNRRLGIVGGLSVLGTTGVVVPYSCASWIHAIHRGIDVARAAGLRHIVAATGATSEKAVQRLLRAARARADRYGRFCRRHAQIPALASGAASDPGRRVRETRQAGRRPSRPAFEPQPGRSRDARRSAGRCRRRAARRLPPQCIATAPPKSLPLPARSARPSPNPWPARAREVALATLSGGVAVEVAIVDRAGVFLAHVGAPDPGEIAA